MVQDDSTNPQPTTSKLTHSAREMKLYRPMLKSDLFLPHRDHHERIDPGQVGPINCKGAEELRSKPAAIDFLDERDS